MKLTQAGERLFRSTKQAFAELTHGVGHVRRLHKSSAITVSLSTSLALKWFVPKLPAFHKEHPNITLLIDTNDAGFSDAVRDVWVTRGVAWRRRSAQAGNRGFGLGGSVVMGI